MQENPLRSRVARVSVSTYRLNAEGAEPVVDDSGDCFAPIHLGPINLPEPVTECGFVGFVARATVKAHTADDASVSVNAMAKRCG